MKKESNSKTSSRTEIIKITTNLAAACLIAGSCIAAVYAFTEPFAERNRIKMHQAAMLQLIPGTESFVQIEHHPQWYKAESNSCIKGFIINVQTSGYGGLLKILAAVDTNYRIIDYAILSHNETPGLGDKADKPGFKHQFTGKMISQLFLSKTNDTAGINAITGATITSKAVTDGIRKELELFISFMNASSKSLNVTYLKENQKNGN